MPLGPKFKKIFGWILLVTGILIIFLVLYSSYNIFTAKTGVPEIFELPEEKEVFLPSQERNLNIEEEIKKTIEEEITKIFSVKTMITLFNLIAWSIFAGILIFGGAQISSLGIKLIKE